MLGLTNYSQWEHARSLRACLQSAEAAAQASMLDLAVRRLGTFAHVSVMEQLEDAVSSIAALLDLRMNGPAWQVPPDCTQSHCWLGRMSAPSCKHCICCWTRKAVKISPHHNTA